MRFAVAAAGLKGFRFLSDLILRNKIPEMVASYPQADDASKSFDEISRLCNQNKIPFEISKRPQFKTGDIFFFVGWQFKLDALDERACVFHDSILPRYRGFAPTVTALLNGDGEIGVTALRPTNQIDAGPIISQAILPIKYPMKIRRALELQTKLMSDLVMELLNSPSVSAAPQDHAKATYSVWRDAEDYFVAWHNDAHSICRHIDAVGYPYEGARAVAANDVYIIDDAEPLNDLTFERRDIGKIWSLDEGRPVIICGKGLVRINVARTLNGESAKFDRLRLRFSLTSP